MDELRRSSLEILRKQYQRMGGVFSLLGAFGAKDSRIIRYDTRDSCIKIRGGRVWWKELQCALLRQGGLKIGYVERAQPSRRIRVLITLTKMRTFVPRSR